jgi:hypothetical protein
MKPTPNCLKLEEGRWGKERAIEGVNLIKVQYMHI